MCAFIPLTLSIMQLIPIEASSSSFDFPLPTLSDPRRSAGVSAAGGVRLVVSLSVCLSMRSLTLFDDRSRRRPPSLRRPARGSFPWTRGKALRSRPKQGVHIDPKAARAKCGGSMVSRRRPHMPKRLCRQTLIN